MIKQAKPLKMFSTNSKFRKFFLKIIESNFFQNFIKFTLLLNFINLAYFKINDNHLLLRFITFVYIIEFIFKIIGYGIINYFKYQKNIYEAIIVISYLITLIIDFFADNKNNSTFFFHNILKLTVLIRFIFQF